MFSDANFRQWNKQAAALEQYQIAFFYCLEAQRKVDRGGLCRALESARRTTPLEFSDWVRICRYRYSRQPLNAYGSTIGAGGRFNFGDGLDNVDAQAFPALYVGANKTVAYREAFALSPNDKTVLTSEEFSALPNKSHSVVFINGWVDNVLDLTRKERLQDLVDIIKAYKLSDSVKDLAKKAGVPNRPLVRDTAGLMNALYEVDWRGWPTQLGLPASCQTFGKLAWEAGFDAVLYRSTKGGGQCLAVYPQNLHNSESRLWLSEKPPPGTAAQLDSSNWQLALAP